MLLLVIEASSSTWLSLYHMRHHTNEVLQMEKTMEQSISHIAFVDGISRTTAVGRTGDEVVNAISTDLNVVSTFISRNIDPDELAMHIDLMCVLAAQDEEHIHISEEHGYGVRVFFNE